MSKKYNIDACIKQYEDTFQDDWIEQLDWSTENIAKESLKKGREKIANFQRFCFIRISKSLLGGEYVTFKSSFDNAKNRFEQYWTQEHFCPKNNENEIVFSLKNALYRQYEILDNYLKILFYDYIAFIISINERIDYANHEYIFKAQSSPSLSLDNFQYFTILREVIFPLCYSEQHLSLSNKNLKRITILLQELEHIKSDETDEECKLIYTLAIYKATFILKKLLKKTDSFEVLIDITKKKITRANLQSIPSELEQLFSYFENIHEDQPYSESEMVDYQKKISNGSGSFLEMARLMHYYCSQTKSAHQIDILLDKFELKFNKLYNTKIKHEFDKYALCTLRNFMYNCRLSYRIRQKKYTIKFLQEDINEIEGLQEETLVKNFYPYKKAIEFLINKLKKLIEERDVKFDYEENLLLLERYLKIFDENILWCSTHCFYPIQLMLKECVVNINGEQLILPSSISRPVDYDKLRSEREKYRSDIDYIRNSLIYIKDKKDTNTIKEELNSIEKRYLEVGGILTGIITFLFGTINIFTQNTSNPHQLLLSTLNLGILLVIFATLLIIVIENWKGNIQKIKVSICGIIFIIYTILLCFITLKTNTKESTNKIQQIKNVSQKTDTCSHSSVK